MTTLRIALAQLGSGPDPAANLDRIGRTVERAAADGARLVVFPEASMRCFGLPLFEVAEPVDGPWATAVRALARRHDVVVVVGMFVPAPDGRVLNVALATGGGVEAAYAKIHLFDAFGFTESATVAPGADLVVIDVDGVGVGLATCYDVRFPTLFTALADRGADVICLPTSWGPGPGKVDQWRLLTRARALDATCFVLAAGQPDAAAAGVGAPTDAPTGIGHSVVVAPDGVVLAELDEGPDLVVLDLDLDAVARTRATLPVLANRRLDR